MRMEQYIHCIDYTLWEIIENSNAPIVTKTVDGKETIIPPTSVENKSKRRAELKARSTLLMALPNEHQLTFNLYKDLKTLMQAIENRFGGNTATKKTQKNLLKQQYENFAASSIEVIEQTYERLQKIISQLEMHENETLSLDDLFNNLKAYESEARRFLKNTRRKLYMPNKERIRVDKSKVECFNSQKRGHFASDQAEEAPTNFALMAYPLTSSSSSTNSKIMDKCKIRLGYNVVPSPYTGYFRPPKPDLVYPSLDNFVDVNESFSESIVEKPTVETNEPKTARKENEAPIIEDWVSE
ncbi:hypothetical protein Tco_0335728 [Tanacetum coccineum]